MRRKLFDELIAGIKAMKQHRHVAIKPRSATAPDARNVRVTHDEQLSDPDVGIAYIEEAIETGDKSTILRAIRRVAEAQVASSLAGKTD